MAQLRLLPPQELDTSLPVEWPSVPCFFSCCATWRNRRWQWERCCHKLQHNAAATECKNYTTREALLSLVVKLENILKEECYNVTLCLGSVHGAARSPSGCSEYCHSRLKVVLGNKGEPKLIWYSCSHMERQLCHRWHGGTRSIRGSYHCIPPTARKSVCACPVLGWLDSLSRILLATDCTISMPLCHSD